MDQVAQLELEGGSPIHVPGVRIRVCMKMSFGQIWVPSPAEFGEPLLEFGVGPYDLVGWKVDEDPGTSPWGGGGAWMGRVLALERFPGWVGYQTSHTIFVEHPNAGHDSGERDRRSGGEIKRAKAVKARRVGESTHQVPIEIGSTQGKALVIRWLLGTSRKRLDRNMAFQIHF
ncbi:hypothetical protein Csa_020846 [Cucumis sativus]|nr:hypothetical protein Csa_020846 [Cucumis sativus]